jgi:hypothetical protein
LSDPLEFSKLISGVSVSVNLFMHPALAIPDLSDSGFPDVGSKPQYWLVDALATNCNGCKWLRGGR